MSGELASAARELLAATEDVRWHIGGKDKVTGGRYLDAVLRLRAALAAETVYRDGDVVLAVRPICGCDGEHCGDGPTCQYVHP